MKFIFKLCVVALLCSHAVPSGAKAHNDKGFYELKGPVKSVVYYQAGEYDKTVDFDIYGYSNVPGQCYEYNEWGWPDKIIEKPGMLTGMVNLMSLLAGEDVPEPRLLANISYVHEDGKTVETQVYPDSRDTLVFYRSPYTNEIEYWMYGITTFRNTVLERDSIGNWTRRKVSAYALGDCCKEWFESRNIEYYQLEDDGLDLSIDDIINKPLGKVGDADGLWSLCDDDVRNFIIAHKDWSYPGNTKGLWNSFKYNLEGHYGYKSRYHGVCPVSIYYDTDRDDHSSICSWEYTFYFDMEGRKPSGTAYMPKQFESSEQEVMDYMNQLLADLKAEGIVMSEMPGKGKNAIGETCKFSFGGSDRNTDYLVKLLQLKDKNHAYRKVMLQMRRRQ